MTFQTVYFISPVVYRRPMLLTLNLKVNFELNQEPDHRIPRTGHFRLPNPTRILAPLARYLQRVLIFRQPIRIILVHTRIKFQCKTE